MSCVRLALRVSGKYVLKYVLGRAQGMNRSRYSLSYSPVPVSTLSTPRPYMPPTPSPIHPLPHASVLVFSGHKNELAQLAAQGPENPKLEMLEGILLKQFGSPNHPRGIIFTRTRQSAYSLLLWLWQQPGLQNMNIKAQMLIGAGNTSQSTHMTQVFGFGWRHFIGKSGDRVISSE